MLKPRARVINEILRSKRSEKHQDKNSPKRLRKQFTPDKVRKIQNGEQT